MIKFGSKLNESTGYIFLFKNSSRSNENMIRREQKYGINEVTSMEAHLHIFDFVVVKAISPCHQKDKSTHLRIWIWIRRNKKIREKNNSNS